MKDHDYILLPDFIDRIVIDEMTATIEGNAEAGYGVTEKERKKVTKAAKIIREYYGG